MSGMERPRDAVLAPQPGQREQPVAHGERHARAAQRVGQGPLGLGVAEEHQDRVTDELVDRAALRVHRFRPCSLNMLFLDAS